MKLGRLHLSLLDQHKLNLTDKVTMRIIVIGHKVACDVTTPTNVEFNCEFFFKGPTTIRNQILYCPRMQRKVGNGCQVQLGEGSFL